MSQIAIESCPILVAYPPINKVCTRSIAGRPWLVEHNEHVAMVTVAHIVSLRYAQHWHCNHSRGIAWYINHNTESRQLAGINQTAQIPYMYTCPAGQLRALAGICGVLRRRIMQRFNIQYLAGLLINYLAIGEGYLLGGVWSS